MTALGYRYYTLEPRPIPYKPPGLTTHPASEKAKDAAESLNNAYQEISDLHQTIKSKLDEFKKLVGQPMYSDLSSCFASLKTLSNGTKVELVCSETTSDPVELVGGSEKSQEAVNIFNEMLGSCHQFLRDNDQALETIKERIASLRQLAIMQQILDICSTFETHAPTNVGIFATEIRSLLLDVRSAAKKLK